MPVIAPGKPWKESWNKSYALPHELLEAGLEEIQQVKYIGHAFTAIREQKFGSQAKGPVLEKQQIMLKTFSRTKGQQHNEKIDSILSFSFSYYLLRLVFQVAKRKPKIPTIGQRLTSTLSKSELGREGLAHGRNWYWNMFRISDHSSLIKTLWHTNFIGYPEFWGMGNSDKSKIASWIPWFGTKTRIWIQRINFHKKGFSNVLRCGNSVLWYWLFLEPTRKTSSQKRDL